MPTPTPFQELCRAKDDYAISSKTSRLSKIHLATSWRVKSLQSWSLKAILRLLCGEFDGGYGYMTSKTSSTLTVLWLKAPLMTFQLTSRKSEFLESIGKHEKYSNADFLGGMIGCLTRKLSQ